MEILIQNVLGIPTNSVCMEADAAYCSGNHPNSHCKLDGINNLLCECDSGFEADAIEMNFICIKESCNSDSDCGGARPHCDIGVHKCIAAK